MGGFVIKKFDESHRGEVEELSDSACIPLLKEDFDNMFVILENNSFCGFVFIRMFEGFAEMNGPVLKKIMSEEDMKKLLKKTVKILRSHYPDTVFYVLTDYPEFFEKMGCRVAFDVPHEIMLKMKPT